MKWWNTQQAIARRDMRRVIKELFEEADDDRSGILEKDEFAKLVDKANNNLGLPALFAGGPNDPDSDSKERFMQRYFYSDKFISSYDSKPPVFLYLCS